jgi:hypothetical protein
MMQQLGRGILPAWPVALIGPRGEHLFGSVLRIRDELLTVAIRFSQSRAWRRGDEIDVLEATRPGDGVPMKGRICSVYKTIDADHVVIDLADAAARSRSRAVGERSDRRKFDRVRPEPTQPLLAIVSSGGASVEGRARNVSTEGMTLYVPGHHDTRAIVGDSVTLIVCLPGNPHDHRFTARVIRKEPMRHGIVYGLQLDRTDSFDSMRRQAALLNYVSLRQDESHPFGRRRR